ncbi:NAC domain-containing protein 89 [Hirschfeldia incana]|nr:NAC domain-containing protein 89 [Hirschfeldia incana]
MEAVALGVSKDMVAPVEASTVFPGFKFSPTDVELISYYLKRKMDGLERSVEVIPETDIYSFEPWDLPDKSIIKSDTEWFFFCCRGKKYPPGLQNRRTTKMGYWKVTGKERDVKSCSQVIGTKRTLVFHIGRAPKGQRTEWLMHEYCMKGGVFMDDALAVCRLMRNREFRTYTSQKAPPEPDLASDKHMILQKGEANSGSPSDWESMVDFYLAGESGDNHVIETPENLQVEAEEDLYGDILRDDIINLDEVVMMGKAPNKVPTLESASMAIRILPLPNMIDRHMASFLEERPSQENKGKGSSGTEPLSSCFIGLYSIKSVNRARWDVIIGVVGLIVVLFFSRVTQ